MKRDDKSYKHAELIVAQVPKRPGAVCGDVVVSERTPLATTVAVCDGIGSGIRASIAATMCAARLMELIRSGMSLRDTFRRVAGTMHAARTEDIPFAAFSVVRILPDGTATVLSYEMPPPVLLQACGACVPKQRFFTMSGEVVGEVNCVVEPGDALFLLTDGVTQAGMGNGLPMGWTADGAVSCITGLARDHVAVGDMPDRILRRVHDLSGGVYGDDTTVALLACRRGTTIHVLSGPPERGDDEEVVGRFAAEDGMKVVCGSTTAEITARVLDREVRVGEVLNSQFEPPEYFIDGIDLVTEGALTLNQVYNILDEKVEDLDMRSSVSRLAFLLQSADRVYFRLGKAANPGHNSLAFRQMGILPRGTIVPLIAEKLKKAGKLVVVTPV